jgi:predicted DNA-binding transcriptional regulator YafY
VSSARGKATLVRQWGLLQLLRPAKRGLTARDILARSGIRRATLYRDLATLREAGVPLQSETVNGEVRHSLWGHDLPPLGPSVLQIAALRLARRGLVGLEGTSATAELDKLLAGYTLAGSSRDAIVLAKHHVSAPKVVKQLDRAVHAQRRTRILYRSAKAAAASWRNVDPLGMRFVGGHLYFIAHDDKRSAPVAFKLDRISQVTLLAEKAAIHPEVDLHELFARSAKTWIGEHVDVVIRLSPTVARFAREEYRLVPDQTLQDEPNGAAVLRARVAGIAEPMRWVLAWGKEAEALEPKALRDAVAAEVRAAAERYRDAGRTVGKASASELEERGAEAE